MVVGKVLRGEIAVYQFTFSPLLICSSRLTIIKALISGTRMANIKKMDFQESRSAFWNSKMEKSTILPIIIPKSLSNLILVPFIFILIE